MEIRSGFFYFPPMRGSGPLTQTRSFNFAREVERAIAGLSGYSVGYSPGDDHHLGKLDIRLDTEIDGDMVTVVATYGLRDWSGSWDDDYTGTVQFILLAEQVPPTALAPRTDLTITGMEFNQAIQYFRSSQHLDAANVRPDNSIRLVARKSTGVRVYVDYDPVGGQKPITNLSGVLEVSTSIGSTVFTLNPRSAILPRHDTQIDRAQVGHTLNFTIPEGWCQGELRLHCFVFDATNPSQHSQSFQRTLYFDDLQPLRVFGVGVHYTGQGLNLATPNQTDLVNTLDFVEKVYPIGEALITGYTTIDFAEDMQADIANGCGNGFNELLDRLRDMRGDSDDIYYALLPNGITQGTVGGCGGGGVSAGYIYDGPTAAQEIGHAFGLSHAPCDTPSRCLHPADPDENYPHYASYPSDSIGEFGFDPAPEVVKNPANTYDFMSYSGPDWVSPYTYNNLMRHFPSSTGISASATNFAYLRALDKQQTGAIAKEKRAEWLRARSMTLFLGLTIGRDRVVERRPSFHFPTYANQLPRHCTSFSLELLDNHGRTLVCQPLYCECTHCGCDKCQPEQCWPKIIRQPVPFPKGVAKLVIWEGKDRIYEEDIPTPPSVRVNAQYDAKTHEFEIHWSAVEESKQELWYLVQCLEEPDTWRSLLPRTQQRSLRLSASRLVSASHLGKKKEVQLRVLATSGIATGVGEYSLAIEHAQPPGEPKIVLVGQASEGELTLPQLSVIRVSVLDGLGRSVADPEILWVNEEGRELGRGRTLDLRLLPEGPQILRAVVLGQGSWASEQVWTFERLESGGWGLRPLPRRLTFSQVNRMLRQSV